MACCVALENSVPAVVSFYPPPRRLTAPDVQPSLATASVLLDAGSEIPELAEDLPAFAPKSDQAFSYYSASALQSCRAPRSGAGDGLALAETRDAAVDGSCQDAQKTDREKRREELLRRSSSLSTAPCRAHNRAIVAANSPAEIFDIFDRVGAGFDGVNFSTALARIAKLVEAGGRVDAAQLTRLREAAAAKLHQFPVRQVCSVAWSLGKLAVRDRPMLGAVASLVAERFRLLSPKDLGIVTWGFASARYRYTPALSAIGAVAIDQSDILEPTEVANVLWGFATLQFRQGQVMARLAPICTGNVDAFQAKELASVLWSYSSLSYRDDHETRVGTPLFTEVGDMLLHRIDEFDPQALTNLVWSYANILHRAPDGLLQRCASRLCTMWKKLKAQEIANAIWAYERLGSNALVDPFVALYECGNDLSFQSWTGEQLLKLTGCLEAQRPGCRAQVVACDTFERRFGNPVCNFFKDFSPNASRENYERTMREFGLFHFGPVTTPRILSELGLTFVDLTREATFRQEAMDALLRYYTDGDGSPAAKEPAMLHGGQTTSRWIAAELRFALHGPGRRTSRTGRHIVPATVMGRPGRDVADFGLPSAITLDVGVSGSSTCEPARAVDQWLRSVKLAGDVGRNSHCEYKALAEIVVDNELRALGLPVEQSPMTASDYEGEVLLFTTHYPCLSCMGVLAQFRACFPNIQVHVSYVEWRDWQRSMRRAVGCNTWDGQIREDG
eukprot:TRINITY_DN30430_c0_g1_i1.p1 TRINITY_DN30430_c0_g1~~TRINITY_DN30430_c0_g1_i1.p1  ORF type:complete len:730 (-),score=93.95 TRINITY_DN30430_c0_g1_i1:86-2275(-)